MTRAAKRGEGVMGTLVGETAPPGSKGRPLKVLLIVATLVVAGVGTGVILATSGGDDKTAGGNRSPTPSSSSRSSLSLLKPMSLQVVKTSAFRVTITWAQPPGGAVVTGFNIYRNGSLAGSVDQSTTTFTDVQVTPGNNYTYEIKATGAGQMSEAASVDVKILVPPLSSARLEGTYNVRLKDTSHSGFDTFGGAYTAGWRFEPKCTTGTCDVVWINLNDKDLKATFKRRGARYTGADKGQFNVTCDHSTVISSVTIRVRVVKARGIDGEWIATKLTGTMEQTEPPQLGCGTFRATYSLALTRLG